MMNVSTFFGSVSVAVISASIYYGWFSVLIWILLHCAVGGAGFYYALHWNMTWGKPCRLNAAPPPKSTVNIIVNKMMTIRRDAPDQPRKVVISRSLDNTLQEVLDLICKTFISTWYETLTNDKSFFTAVQSEMWVMIDKLSRRLAEVDLVSFLSQDLIDCLHDHFKDIRLAKKEPEREKTEESEQGSRFILHSWLKDDERELDCLRNVSDALLINLTSKPYGSCAPVRHLLREIFATSVLKPTIELICDPDFINLQLLEYMSYREKMNSDIKRTYMYSATYEGFMKLIKSSESVEELLQMRYNIISEIFQASAINNLKKQHGLTTDKELAAKSTNKGVLLKARNLEKYKKQLTMAKQLCEKRIVSLGGSVYEHSKENTSKKVDIPGQKVFSFSVIMETGQGREFFLRYLKKVGADSYLSFWIAVEKLRATSKEQSHHAASNIYQQFIVSSSSLVKVNKTVLKGMEDFLRGDKESIESFTEAQKQVENVLEEEHYPSFIVSDTYSQFAIEIGDQLSSKEIDVSAVEDELFLESRIGPDEMEDSVIAGQSYHAQQRLRTLDNKITNKARALMAQRASQKTDGSVKIKKVQEDMEKELENLKTEKRSLEMHIARTQKWTDFIGQWIVNVYDASVMTMDDDKKVLQFVLLVSLSSSEPSSEPLSQSSTEGWAIQRDLDDFHALHEKLEPICPWLQKKELPSNSKLFRQYDRIFIEKSKNLLNDYLKDVMQDEKMVHSEALYAFLSPNPEFVHQPAANEKKNKFALAQILKSLPTMRSENQENDDDYMFSDENCREEKGPDSIAKPLYRLVGEVFELQGMFRWFRRSLISFVELTFGRSIDRQLKDTVDWLVSEQMLIYYTQILKDSLWPNGEWNDAEVTRTDEQKQADRTRAKTALLENMPDTLKSLVGEDNGRRGMIKIFEVLQNRMLNKHLVYNVLELIVMEILQDGKKTKEIKQRLLQGEQDQAIREQETNL